MARVNNDEKEEVSRLLRLALGFRLKARVRLGIPTNRKVSDVQKNLNDSFSCTSTTPSRTPTPLLAPENLRQWLRKY
jgi:hypothetical protein